MLYASCHASGLTADLVVDRVLSLPRNDCTGRGLTVILLMMRTSQYLCALQLWTGKLPFRGLAPRTAELEGGKAGCLLTPLNVSLL